MTTSTATIPVTISPEAAARIAELEFQTPVEQMIDHACHHLPDVVRVKVVLNERYDVDAEPGIAVEVYGAREFDPNDTGAADLIRWEITTFPPNVLEHLLITYLGGMPHAGQGVPG